MRTLLARITTNCDAGRNPDRPNDFVLLGNGGRVWLTNEIRQIRTTNATLLMTTCSKSNISMTICNPVRRFPMVRGAALA